MNKPAFTNKSASTGICGGDQQWRNEMLTGKEPSMFGRLRRGAGAALLVAATIVSATAASADGFWKGVQDRGTLRCAYAFAPPYMMQDINTGEYRGTYLDLCKDFAEVLGVKVEFVSTDWGNIVAGLQSGAWDLSPALNRTPQRALSVHFSVGAGYDGLNFTYLKSNAKLASIGQDPASFDVAGIRIGTVSGSSHDKALTDHFKAAEIVRYPDAGALQMALMSGQIDMIGTEVIINSIFAKAHESEISMLEPNPPLLKGAVAFGLPPSTTFSDIEVLNIFLEDQTTLGLVDKKMDGYVAELAAKSK